MEAWALLGGRSTARGLVLGPVVASGVGSRHSVLVPVERILGSPSARALWHSHPAGPPDPSPEDLAVARCWPQLVFLLRSEATWAAWDGDGPRLILDPRTSPRRSGRPPRGTFRGP
jgi:hypothetical protein